MTATFLRYALPIQGKRVKNPPPLLMMVWDYFPKKEIYKLKFCFVQYAPTPSPELCPDVNIHSHEIDGH